MADKDPDVPPPSYAEIQRLESNIENTGVAHPFQHTITVQQPPMNLCQQSHVIHQGCLQPMAFINHTHICIKCGTVQPVCNVCQTQQVYQNSQQPIVALYPAHNVPQLQANTRTEGNSAPTAQPTDTTTTSTQVEGKIGTSTSTCCLVIGVAILAVIIFTVIIIQMAE